MENTNFDEVKKMLRIAFRATFSVLEQTGQTFTLGKELDEKIANMKQDVLYNPQVVEILQSAGLDEKMAGQLIDESMNKIVHDLFYNNNAKK